MLDFKRPFIQVAGVIDFQDAETLAEFEQIYIGFPFRLGYHREDISIGTGSDIISYYNLKERAVLITYLERAADIIYLLNYLNLNIVQIHGDINIYELRELREIKPDVQIIKSLIVKSDNFFELDQEVNSLAGCVNAFITDTYDEGTTARGATGKTHDWKISETIRKLSPKPVILAGGLNPENVADGIMAVQPAGVDAHTGLEDSSGRKDKNKVETFINNALAEFGKYF